jgi:hypothetical protein
MMIEDRARDRDGEGDESDDDGCECREINCVAFRVVNTEAHMLSS